MTLRSVGMKRLPPVPVGRLFLNKMRTGVPDYYNTPNWANSPQLRKFVDTLPPLCGAAGSATNNLGQCIPVAIPDKTTYPGSDYYEIEVVEYREQMHSDLPAVVGDKMTATTGGTKLRGYRQTNTTNANLLTPHYLGPVIVATKGTPVWRDSSAGVWLQPGRNPPNRMTMAATSPMATTNRFLFM